MGKMRYAAAAIVVFALIVGACGDDGNKTAAPTGATSGSTATGGTGGSASGGSASAGSGASASAACTISSAPKLIGLFEKKGESVNAIDDFANGSQMAVDEINAAGGVCGQKIDWERLPASPTDTNQAKNAFLSAVDKKATLMLGPISSTPILAIAPEVQKAGIPVLYMSVCPQCLTGQSAGSDSGFTIRPNNTGIAALQVDYIINELKKKKIGLSCVEQPFGQQGCDDASAKIKELGGEVVARETNATTASDLTAQVLSYKSKGAEAILGFNFPNPMVVLANQLADNGVNVPLFGGSSAGIGVASGSIKTAALANLWGTDDCAPAALADPVSKSFADAYTAKYGKALPGTGYTAAEAYDGIKMAAAAITQAKSTDPKQVAAVLRTITYKGVCATYHANAGQGMHTGTVVEQFDSKGIPVIKKSFTVT